MKRQRRQFLVRSAGLGSIGVAGAMGAIGLLGTLLQSPVMAADAKPIGAKLAKDEPKHSAKEIEVVAQRFKYTPAEIPVPAGQAVVLLVRSLDFVHGMNFPELGIRSDLVPGRVTRIELPPMKPGTIDFLCDNFCGDGHEEMHGRLLISA